MSITACILDSREPQHIQKFSMGGVPVSVAALPCSDAMMACDDGSIVLVERKSLSDLLGSIKDGRVFVQVSDMSTMTRWVYLVVTDPITYGPHGTVITSHGETGWSFNSIWGALTTLQELGAFVVFCAGEQDYEACLLRIASRSRDLEQTVEPAKTPYLLSIQEQIMASLPGIGPDRARELITQFGSPANALMGLTDPSWDIPGIKGGIKAKVRNALKLAEGQQLIVTSDQSGQEWVEVQKIYTPEKNNE